MRLRTLFLTLSLIVLVACTGTAPTMTPEPPPTGTATPRPTSTPAPTPTSTLAPLNWVRKAGVPSLTDDPSWACLDGVQAVDGQLVIQAGSGYRTVLNTLGSHLEFDGDFGASADLEVTEGDWGAFVLLGALSQGEWWKGIKRLDLSWHGGRVDATFWDGTQQSPQFTKRFPSENTSARAEVGLRRQRDQLFVVVDGVDVGQIADPGMFPGGVAYLGANVPTGGELVLHGIWPEVAQGQENAVQVKAPSETGVYVPGAASLRDLADARGLSIGAAVSPGPLGCEASYADALSHEFNMLTPENAMKFGPIHPQPTEYDFGDADEMVDFAEEHGMLVRGHTLVWHNQLPPWIEEGNWTREELMEALHDHISTVVGRYRGRVHAWDVVNEAVADGGSLRNTVWMRVIGPEYIELAFEWAHEADPDALLFYNDYACETLCRKSDAIYALAQDLLESGVPLHGVGLQTHISAASLLDMQSVRDNVQRMADLGLEVHITELDVRIQGQPSEVELNQQAIIYQDLMNICLSVPECTAYVMWGFTDRYSWIPAHNPGWGSALIFDEAYQPKPAYHALQEALAAAED